MRDDLASPRIALGWVGQASLTFFGDWKALRRTIAQSGYENLKQVIKKKRRKKEEKGSLNGEFLAR